MRHYQIVIFKDSRGVCRKITVKGWILAVLFLFVAGLAGLDLYLGNSYLRYLRLLSDYESARKDLAAQKAQLGELAAKVGEINAGLSRIQAFDAKLKAMLGIDHEIESARRPAETGDAAKDDAFPKLRQELGARRLAGFLQRLKAKTEQAEISRGELLAAVEAAGDSLAAAPTVWPVEGVIAAEFGQRVSPVTGKSEFLRAVEISAPAGTPVHATASGRITAVAAEPGIGSAVVVNHGGGFSTVYTGVTELTVKEGMTVDKGRVIGKVGPGSKLTGPQLRYEVRLQGVPVNPKRFVLE